MENHQDHAINHNKSSDPAINHNKEPSYRKKLNHFLHSTLGQDTMLIHLVFLKFLAVVYVAVFTSIFFQIPAVLGENGLASVGAQRLHEGNNPIIQTPTLLLASDYVNSFIITLFPSLGAFPAYENTLYLMCFINIAIAFGILIDSKAAFFMKSWSFAVMWISFLSIYVIAESIFTSDADKLLLDIGFIAIFFVPGKRKGTLYLSEFAYTAKELLKWLAFRFIFMNGVGKLLRGDSTWWNLSAYSYYSQTYPLPGPFAKFFHYLPKEIHHVAAALTLSGQIFCPLLFYAPIPGLRTGAVFVNIVSQVFEMAAGNFSWLNLCAVLLLITILDGDIIQNIIPGLVLKSLGISTANLQSNSQKLGRPIIPHSIEFILCSIIIATQFALFFPLEQVYAGRLIFDLKYLRENIINSYYLTIPLYSSICFGALRIIQGSISLMSGNVRNILLRIIKSIFAFCFFILMFAASLPPFFENIQAKLSCLPINPDYLNKVYQSTQAFHITHSYTPLYIIKGVQGRNELVIQGSYDNEHWIDYEFLYKPGKLEQRGRLSALYQPIVDLKLSEAAYSDINHEVWLIHLIRKLFANSIEISHLIKESPFQHTPPDYLRIKLFKYKCADPKSNEEWEVISVEDYLPPIHKKDPVIQEFLEKREYPISPIEEKRQGHPCEGFPLLKWIYIATVFATAFIWAS